MKLCGWTFGGLFEPKQIVQFVDPVAFLCVLYELNLLNQGINSYFTEGYEWQTISEPFPDIRGCMTYHGGITHKPNSILEFAARSGYIPGMKPVIVPLAKLREFTQHFIHGYLGDVCRVRHFSNLTPDKLIVKLVDDPDCPEFRQFISEKANVIE